MIGGNEQCRECWDETRHQVINRTVQMGLHAHRVSLLVDETVAEHQKISKHLEAIMKKAREIDEYFKNNKG